MGLMQRGLVKCKNKWESPRMACGNVTDKHSYRPSIITNDLVTAVDVKALKIYD